MNAWAIPGLKERPKLNRRAIMAQDIIAQVSKAFQIDSRHMFRQVRERKYLLPRQVAIWLIKKKTTLALKDIAEIFSTNRKTKLDHTNVIHTVRLINNLMETNEQLIPIVKDIEEKLIEI